MNIDTNKQTKYALLSVYDKQGIKEIASALQNAGYTIMATSGTGRALIKAGISYKHASKMTGNPPILTDCIQTLSFKLEGGILFNRHNERHLSEVKQEGLPRIDVVVCNFTDISETIKRPDDFNIQHVDLGGPLMVRSACINYKDVLVIVRPDDYKITIDALGSDTVDEDFRYKMAIKGLTATFAYDETLVNYLRQNPRR